MAADDVAAGVGRVAVGEPLNGIREIGGPEQFRLELVREALAAKGDPREVVADEQARYSGARVSERTLIPGPDAQLGEITFDSWLAQQRKPVGRRRHYKCWPGPRSHMHRPAWSYSCLSTTPPSHGGTRTRRRPRRSSR